MYLSSSSSVGGGQGKGEAEPLRSLWDPPPPPPPGIDAALSSPSADSRINVPPPPSSSSSLKRSSSDALYHPTIFGAYNTLGPSEAWYSTGTFYKRPRYESASNLPIYPQRPGEKDCAHYMLTRTCKFGDSCKFDHPVWVPEGGIPNWKEVPVIVTSESLPERPGEPDCPYFLKTQRCKYGLNCKFNHPKDKLALGASGVADISTLPERPSEPLCAFYLKTGKCKFGATCKFHHPKDVQIMLTGHEDGEGEQNTSVSNTKGSTDINVLKASVSITPALFHNSKGLPMRLGEADCPFYMKTGSCKYGATCRYNHPDRSAIIPPAATIGHPLLSPTAAGLNFGVVNPAIYHTIDPTLTQPRVEAGSTIYPQKPGLPECDYYMKNGTCKFGERCKFHHPLDRSAQPSVKLTLAGLPRREDAVHCPYYMKTGACKYGATCKFDHPPPAEVMVTGATQASLVSTGVELKEAEAENNEDQ